MAMEQPTQRTASEDRQSRLTHVSLWRKGPRDSYSLTGLETLGILRHAQNTVSACGVHGPTTPVALTCFTLCSEYRISLTNATRPAY